jgi:hypothetical protein
VVLLSVYIGSCVGCRVPVNPAGVVVRSGGLMLRHERRG